ncbi:hypothetical protein CEXT_552641 [Caerostris extrusa]|uniref:Uncharacterized protein n=1 Tax=Caerostris extrusa TaxID=172846 RepID=A0AAV4UWZ0_CAEEX|nr:hypothetical protein CEXT_552641 [Caerostris extrusa]
MAHGSNHKDRQFSVPFRIQPPNLKDGGPFRKNGELQFEDLLNTVRPSLQNFQQARQISNNPPFSYRILFTNDPWFPIKDRQFSVPFRIQPPYPKDAGPFRKNGELQFEGLVNTVRPSLQKLCN